MMFHKPEKTDGRYGKEQRPLSHLAFHTASAEGAWALTDVEGKIPKNLRGTLYRSVTSSTVTLSSPAPLFRMAGCIFRPGSRIPPTPGRTDGRA